MMEEWNNPKWPSSPWSPTPIPWNPLPGYEMVFDYRNYKYRYALLAGAIHPAPEGWFAFRGFYDSEQAACAASVTWNVEGCWWQVIDLEAGCVVASGRKEFSSQELSS